MENTPIDFPFDKKIRMSPEEKAKYLIQKFTPFVHGYIGSSMLSNFEYPEQILSQAKKVATFVVDEILHEVKYGVNLDWLPERKGGEDFLEYWENVKKEITNN